MAIQLIKEVKLSLDEAKEYFGITKRFISSAVSSRRKSNYIVDRSAKLTFDEAKLQLGITQVYLAECLNVSQPAIHLKLKDDPLIIFVIKYRILGVGVDMVDFEEGSFSEVQVKYKIIGISEGV